MCLQSSSANTSIAEFRQFSQWILDVGDGKIVEPNDGYVIITILDDFLISNFVDPIQAIVDSTYLDLSTNYKIEGFLQCRVILASTIETIDMINDYILSMIPDNNFYSMSSLQNS